MSDETTAQLSRSYYEAEVETLAGRILRYLADDETGELTYEESEIQALLSETETFHEEYPLSAIKHSRYDPSPGAWSWIDNTTPKKGLRRQALDVVAQDVAKLVEQYAESEAYTYREEGIVYVRESFDSEAETSVGKGSSASASKGNRTRLTVRTAISDAPAAGTDEYEQMARALENAIDGALYEHGSVGHDTTVSTEEDR
jgi:hypothetical protein